MPAHASNYAPMTAFHVPTPITEADLAVPRSLAAVGHDEAARQAYMSLLLRDPTHFQCLTELAALAFADGFRSAARTAYEQAVLHHPDEPLGHVNLANMLRAGDELPAAKTHYLAALAVDSLFAPAHQGLAKILAEEGDDIGAAFHRRLGFTGHAVLRRPFRGTASARRILQIVSAHGGNIPTDIWLNDRTFDITSVYAEFFDLDDPLPPHDLVVNAIGDADLCAEGLDAAMRLCAKTNRQVLNAPANVAVTRRIDTASQLADISHIIVPTVRQLPSSLIRAMDEIAFPVLIRRPGYHTGQHFHFVESRVALVATLDALDRSGRGDLLLIDYLDARGSDGMARKYRVMFIDGALYPLHLALSHDWKVHYFTSAMAEDAAYRAEEKRFLDDPASVIGERGLTTIARIADRLGLDYAGIDFGLAADGRLLVFEVNAAMVLIPPAADAVWDYRRPAISRAFEAVARMLDRRMASAPG